MTFHPIIFSTTGQAEQARKDKLFKDLKVKEIVALSYDRTGKANYDGKPFLVEIYDTDGLLMESFRHTEDFIDERLTTSIDSSGNRMKTVSYNEQDFYRYDHDEKLIEYAFYAPTKRLIAKSRFQFEPIAKDKEQCLEIDRRGKLVGKSITKFNDKKLVEFVVHYDRDGYPYAKDSYRYDEQGKLIVESGFTCVEHSLDTNKVKRIKKRWALSFSEFRFHYGKSGNLVERIKYAIDATIDWTESETFKYDDIDRLVQEINYDRDGATKLLVNYMYDSKGRLISKELINPMKKLLFTEKISYSDSGLEQEITKEDFETYSYFKEIYTYKFHEGKIY